MGSEAICPVTKGGSVASTGDGAAECLMFTGYLF